MLLEQEDLRSSIGTLRKDKVSLADTAAEAAALCERLARQWRVECRFTADLPDARVPARLHMDLLHMIKEGVANAVRHASASELLVHLRASGSELHLAVTNDVLDGTAISAAVPWSIRERMHEIGGTVSVSADDDATTLHVTVPMPEEAA
jgi:signal transduction histidine kinase